MAINKKTIIGIAISGICIYFAFKGIQWDVVGGTIARVNVTLLVILMPLYSFAYVVRSIRWHFLLYRVKNVTWITLFPHLMIGFFINNIMPMRLGEFARAYISGKRLEISKTSSFASIVLERTFDGFCFVLLILIGFIFMPFPLWLKQAATASAVFFVGLMILLIFLARHRAYTRLLFGKLPFPTGLKEKLGMLLEKFFMGLDSLCDVKTIVIVFALSCFVWGLELGCFYLMSVAFELHLPFIDILFTAICVVMGVMVPAAPGYLGTYEFAGKTALGVAGVDASIAVSFILFLHFFQFFIISIFGLPSLIVQGFSFKELNKET